MKDIKVKPVELTRFIKGEKEEKADLLAIEEPLEIRLGYGVPRDRQQKSLSVTMRTPGNDFELAAGFLFTEGIINDYNEIEHIHFCTTDKEEEQQNIVRVELKSSVVIDWKKLQRHFYTSSSCGVCGKSSIEAIRTQCQFIFDNFTIDEQQIYELPGKLTGHQPVFTYTGGLHASAVVNAEGEPFFVREDVGRHNALDKVIGAMMMANQWKAKVLVVSGRASFELVQKAARAKIPILVAVGAPSSLAVQLANDLGMSLIGFTRSDRFNIYTRKERLKL